MVRWVYLIDAGRCRSVQIDAPPGLLPGEIEYEGRRWVLDRLHFHPPAYCPVD